MDFSSKNYELTQERKIFLTVKHLPFTLFPFYKAIELNHLQGYRRTIYPFMLISCSVDYVPFCSLG